MTIATQTITSIGSQGNWTTSAGDATSALAGLDSAYLISPDPPGFMWASVPAFTQINAGHKINLVTLRLRCRTANVGLTGSITVAHQGLGDIDVIGYNNNPGSGYSQVAGDGNWDWYEFPYLVSPRTGLPWTIAQLPGATWDRLFIRNTTSTQDSDGNMVHVDMMQVTIDYSAQTLNNTSAVYSGSDPVQRIYLGDSQVWEAP